MFLCTKETFQYFECNVCGTLQIADFPKDMSACYPDNYYSFRREDSFQTNNGLKTNIKNFLVDLRDRHVVNGKGFAGRILNNLFPDIEKKLASLRGMCKHEDIAILDVGCGIGEFLLSLNRLGLSNLEGIDPFISKSIEYPNGVKVHKAELSDFDPGKKKFGIIMLHHVIEHLANPLEVLKRCSSFLSDNGKIIVRTPVTGTFGWKHFAENWVQLDAPRHLFIYSVNSLERISGDANLQIERSFFDATDFLFWGSIQYSKGICLNASNSYMINPAESIFSSDEILKFKKRAKQLNVARDGDQCVLYLSKK